MRPAPAPQRISSVYTPAYTAGVGVGCLYVVPKFRFSSTGQKPTNNKSKRKAGHTGILFSVLVSKLFWIHHSVAVCEIVFSHLKQGKESHEGNPTLWNEFALTKSSLGVDC